MRLVIEEPCELEDGVTHEDCNYLAHGFCNKCGWFQEGHLTCGSRREVTINYEAAAEPLQFSGRWVGDDEPEARSTSVVVRRIVDAALGITD